MHRLPIAIALIVSLIAGTIVACGIVGFDRQLKIAQSDDVR